MALNEFSGAVLLITHDFQILEDSCQNFYILGDGQCKKFAGNIQSYGDWLQQNGKILKKSQIDPVSMPQKVVSLKTEQQKKKDSSSKQRQMDVLGVIVEEKTRRLQELEEALGKEFSEIVYDQFLKEEEALKLAEANYLAALGDEEKFHENP
jgi:ATP-binding cassette subfamily F protein 3